MPTKNIAVSTTEVHIDKDENRTVVILQNIDGAETLYYSDQQGIALAEGIKINPGGSLTLSKDQGFSPENDIYLVATGAMNVRYIEQYGTEYIRTPTVEIPTPTPTPERASGWL